MRPANERQRYNVTSSLIGWAHTQIDPCWNQTATKISTFSYTVNTMAADDLSDGEKISQVISRQGIDQPGPFLLTWINFDPSMDK